LAASGFAACAFATRRAGSAMLAIDMDIAAVAIMITV
jgi:hypothetical protein